MASNPSDTQSVNCDDPDQAAENLSRPELALLCLAVGAGVSLLFSVLSTIIWDMQERAAGSIATYNWSPADDLASIIVLLPLGMIVHSVQPAGWLFWSGFAATLTTRRRGWLMLCASGAMLLGFYWPKLCVGLLGI